MPDSRGWIAIGFFVMIAFIIAMIALNPPLANIDIVKTLSIGLLNGGLLGAAAYYFGSSKSDPKQ